MLGFQKQSTPEQADPGIIHVPLKFDMPAAEWATIKRADLIFEDVNHVGDSFEVRVFFNNPKATGKSARTAQNRYAGRFVVFGHGNCFGAAGHCEPAGAVTRSSLQSAATQLEHPARPHRRMLTVTKALDRVMKKYRKGLHTVTLVVTSKSPRRKDRKPADDLFRFGRLSIQVYN